MFNKYTITAAIFSLSLSLTPCLARAQDDSEDFEDPPVDETTCTNFTLDGESSMDFLIDDSGLVQADGYDNSVGRMLSEEESYTYKQAKNSDDLKPRANISVSLIEGDLTLSSRVNRKLVKKVLHNVDSVMYIKNRADHSLDGLYYITDDGEIKSIDLTSTGIKRKPFTFSFTTWSDADFEGSCEFVSDEDPDLGDDDSELGGGDL